MGNQTFITQTCVKAAESGQNLCSRLAELNDPQSATLLLRHCHVPRVNYLARGVSPDLLYEATKIHNTLTLVTYVEIMEISSIKNGLKLF